MTIFELGTGLYPVTTKCLYCGLESTAPACSNYRPYCRACEYAFDREREYKEWISKPPTFWPYSG